MMDLLVVDMQTEELPDHLLESLEADSVDDVLVDRPALERVEMLVPPHVSRGEKGLVALLAVAAHAGAGDNLSDYSRAGESQVIGQFRMDLPSHPNHVRPTAVGALPTPYFDRPVDRQSPRRPGS